MSSEHGEQTAVALYRLSHVGHTQGIPCGGKVVGDYRLPDIHFQRFDDLVHGRATPGNQQTIRMLDLEERRLGHAVHLLLRDIGDFAPFNIPPDQ